MIVGCFVCMFGILCLLGWFDCVMCWLCLTLSFVCFVYFVGVISWSRWVRLV